MARVVIDAEGNRDAITIYANHLEALNWFLADSLVDEALGEKTRASKSIPGHQRRRGPSDKNPVNVTQSNAEYLVDPSLKSGNAKPGISFILKTTKNSDIDEQRQFTMVGRTLDFVEYFDGRMKYETYFFPANGGRHTLALGMPEGDAKNGVV
jgi:hypothetical protein